MTDVCIYITKFNSQLPQVPYNSYLDQLPISHQEKNSKYVRWQDRHSHLFGKLLLLEGLKNYDYTDDILNNIKYNQNLRPYIDDKIDFNISHSGEFVLCAIGKDLRLGVDIEKITDINFSDFKQVMTKKQWQDINQATNSIRLFFKYWTIKESVIKADSRGLSIPLLDIQINNNEVVYDNQTWYLKKLSLDNQYCAALATNKHSIKVKLNFIDFYNREEHSQ